MVADRRQCSAADAFETRGLECSKTAATSHMENNAGKMNIRPVNAARTPIRRGGVSRATSSTDDSKGSCIVGARDRERVLSDKQPGRCPALQIRAKVPALRAGAFAIALIAACAPEIPFSASSITEPRVLAVRATPAESRPGTFARFEAFVGGPAGVIADAELSWSFCALPRPLGEEGSVAPACFTEPQAVVALGPTLTATVPADGCRLFGPDPPPGNFRARDPDSTGGYQQPILIFGLEPAVAFGHRIRCALARASVDVSRMFEASYRPNEHPRITSLILADRFLELAIEPGSFETYPVVAPGTDEIVSRAEVLTVSWFATAGVIGESRTRLDSSTARVAWESAPGAVTFWAVLRDDRGGVDVAIATNGL